MFGNKIYELSLVKDYVSHWGLAEAARELIQNALDSNSPFSYSFMPGVVEGQGWTFKLTSEFSRLEPSQLLLGSTSKAEDKQAIGSFGEGFKIALLVLTRLGKPTTIYNNELVWTPSFRMNKHFGQELLVISEQRLAKHDPGLSFVVDDLTDADRAAIEACCLKMQPEVGQIIPTHHGDILVDRPGELYVGSLFICKTELKFGYNIKPEFMSLERDRQTVSDFNLRFTTKDMWFETKRYDEIAQMIADEVPDLEYAKYSAPELVKEACYQLFKERNPGALIAETPAQMKEMVEKGLTKTVYVGGGMYTLVHGSAGYRATLAAATKPVPSPLAVLEDWLAKNKFHMHASAQKAFKEELFAAAKFWVAK